MEAGPGYHAGPQREPAARGGIPLEAPPRRVLRPGGSMGLFAEYRASLKPLDVEEPVDVFVHRPVGFIIARLVMAGRRSKRDPAG
jgi:hypothetical protein